MSVEWHDTFTGTNGMLLTARNPDTVGSVPWLLNTGTGTTDDVRLYTGGYAVQNTSSFRNTLSITGVKATRFASDLTLKIYGGSMANVRALAVASIPDVDIWTGLYGGWVGNGTDGSWVIARRVNGQTLTILAQGTNFTPVAGQIYTVVLKVRWDDANRNVQLTLNVDGSDILNATTQGPIGAGYCGIELYRMTSGASNGRIKEFKVETFDGMEPTEPPMIWEGGQAVPGFEYLVGGRSMGRAWTRSTGGP
jgi:hypothetical protein